MGIPIANVIESIYLHVPFCHTLCPFCSFAIAKGQDPQRWEYLYALAQELKRKKQLFAEQIQPLRSIYIGGGTPSCLSHEQIQFLFEQIQLNFLYAPSIEIAFEINPEDATEENIEFLHNIGVNRLSIGIQSLRESVLNTLQRAHDSQKSIQSLQTLNKSSIQNWNADLMFGIPEQSIQDFQQDVEQLLQFDPTHVSLYALELDNHSAFGQNQNYHQYSEQHQEQTFEMYSWAVDRLQQEGIVQYEISNFAKEGFEGKNNLLVWNGAPYLGIGCGAHSYVHPKRWANVRSFRKYIKWCEINKDPSDFHEVLSWSQQANEVLMLALRQKKGLNLLQWKKNFQIQWDSKVLKIIERLREQGHVHWNGERLSLKTEGFFIADAITECLMVK